MKRSPHGTVCTTQGCRQSHKAATFLSGNSESRARRIPLCTPCAEKAVRVGESHGFRVHLEAVQQ